MSNASVQTERMAKEMRELALFVRENAEIVMDLANLRAEQLGVAEIAPIGEMLRDSVSDIERDRR